MLTVTSALTHTFTQTVNLTLACERTRCFTYAMLHATTPQRCAPPWRARARNESEIEGLRSALKVSARVGVAVSATTGAWRYFVLLPFALQHHHGRKPLQQMPPPRQKWTFSRRRAPMILRNGPAALRPRASQPASSSRPTLRPSHCGAHNRQSRKRRAPRNRGASQPPFPRAVEALRPARVCDNSRLAHMCAEFVRTRSLLSAPSEQPSNHGKPHWPRSLAFS